MGTDRDAYVGFGVKVTEDAYDLLMRKSKIGLQAVTSGYEEDEDHVAYFVFLERSLVKFSEDDEANFACIPLIGKTDGAFDVLQEEFQAAMAKVRGLEKIVEAGSWGWYVVLHTW